MRIRPAVAADAYAIAEVHVASWRSTYVGLLPDEVLTNLSVERRQQYWHGELTQPRNPHFIYVAESEDDQIVGFASGGPVRDSRPPYTGELYAIYLLAEHQGKGIGRALAHAIAEHLRAQGMNAMLVWVLKGNPAAQFYEALGGEYVAEKPLTIGGANQIEIAYGWTDTRMI
ncbi:MAG: GNAT family N-acetyltransferase [Anaerolineae bacterium]|nr:GNAT family N-acetyltransferase [Anaerolineae bacterium]